MHGLFRPRHLAVSLLVTAFFGVGTFTAVGFAAADGPDGADGAPFALAPMLAGDAGTFVLEPAVVDDEDQYRGLDPDRHGRIDFAVDDGRPVYDEQGIERSGAPVQIRQEDERGIDETTLVLDPMSRDVILIEYTDTTDYPAVEGEVDRTTWWGAHYPSDQVRTHCLFVPPFEVAKMDGKRHLDERNCEFGPYPLDAGDWYWQAAAVGDQDGVRVLEVHLWYDPGPWRDGPDMQAWYREDLPYPLRLQDNSGYGGVNDGDAWVLTGFERGTAALPSGVTGARLPDIETAAVTDVLLDDRAAQVDFSLTQAVAQARHGHAPMQSFEAEHPDARMYCARHAAFDMEGRHTERWTFWLADGTDILGVAVAKDRQADGPLGQEATTYRYPDAGGCPFGDAPPPRDAFPAEAPTVASLRAVADAILADLYNADGSFGWEFQVMPDGELRIFAGQTYYYRQQSEEELLLGLITGQGDRLDVWDTAAVSWTDGQRTGHGGSEQVHARGSYAEDPPAAPTLAPHSAQAVTGPWTLPPTKAVVGIGIGAGFLGLAYWLSPLAKAPVAALFSRVRKDEALQHPLRAQLMTLIDADPGVHFQDLVRATGKGRGTVEHHLRILTDKDLVRARSGTGYRCYFRTGAVDRRIMDAAPFLKAPAARQILASLATEKRVTDLAAEVGITKGAVSRHVQRLEQAGLVTKRRQGRDQWLQATEVGLAAA